MMFLFFATPFETISKDEVAKIEFKSGDDLTIIGGLTNQNSKFSGWKVKKVNDKVVPAGSVNTQGKLTFTQQFLDTLAGQVELTLVQESFK